MSKIKNHKSLFILLIGIFIGSMFSPYSSMATQSIKLIINNQEIQCDTPPKKINGRVMVPARFVAESLGASVEWDGENKVVRITSRQQGNVTTPPVNTVDGIPTVTPEKDNPKLPVDSSKIENKPQNNTPQYINGDIDANGDGTPDWVTSESDIFERMNQDAPRMN